MKRVFSIALMAMLALFTACDNSDEAGNGGAISGKFDVEFEGTYLNGYYFGDEYAPGVSDLYLIHISDKPMNNAGQMYANATYYRIYAYAPISNSTSVGKGAYGFTEDDLYATSYTVVGQYSGCYLTSEGGADRMLFTDAKMIVSDNKIALELIIDGKRHKVIYNGSLECQDARQNQGDGGDDGGDDSGNNNNPTDGQDGEAESTLPADRHVKFDGEHRAKWGYEGDYWNTGYSNYTIYIMNLLII